jgi:hypothetical protein
MLLLLSLLPSVLFLLSSHVHGFVPTRPFASMRAVVRHPGREVVRGFASKSQGQGQGGPNLDEDGYNIIGTLTRFGPQPALIRIFQPAKYEQAVKNWMEASGCSRAEAQASMDFYFFDPNGWQLNRMTGANPNYLSTGQEKKDLALTVLFGVGVSIWLVYGVSYWIDYWVNDPTAEFWRWSPLLTGDS